MLDSTRYKEIIDSFHSHLLQTQIEITNVRLNEDKWSLREIIGHLIDSASNNHQRFVRLQFDDLLDFPAYTAEEWIMVQNYIRMEWSVLVSLWYNYNCLLINIIENTHEAAYKNVWIKGEEAIPLKQLIDEYFKHLELHMGHYKNRQNELLNKN